MGIICCHNAVGVPRAADVDAEFRAAALYILYEGKTENPFRYIDDPLNLIYKAHFKQKWQQTIPGPFAQ